MVTAGSPDPGSGQLGEEPWFLTLEACSASGLAATATASAAGQPAADSAGKHRRLTLSQSDAAEGAGPSNGMATPEVPQGHGGRSSVARNALFLALGQVVTTALAIVFTAALGRSLGAAEFGLFFLISTMSASAYIVVEWGQTLFVVREAAREPVRTGELLGTALVLRVAFSIAAVIPAGLVSWALGYSLRTTWLFVVLFVANLPFFLSQGYGLAFRARERMGRDAAVLVSNKVLLLCAVLPVLALGAGIPGIILVQAVVGGASLGIAGRLYSRMNAPPLRASRQTARELVAGGLPVLSMSVMTAAQPYLEAVILSKLAPANAVGWFGAAKTIGGTLLAPALMLATAAYPRFARAAADPATLRLEVQAALRPLLWLGALAATGTFLFAGTAVDLVYGSGFSPAATILKVFAPGLFVVFVDVLLGHVLYATGVAVRFAIVLGLKVVVAAGLNILLIPLVQARTGNGGIGVVLSFGLSELFVVAGALVLLRRGTLTTAALVDTARALAAAGMTLLLFWLAPSMQTWWGIPLCILAFGGASWMLGLMRRRDLAILQELIRRTRPPEATSVDAAS